MSFIELLNDNEVINYYEKISKISNKCPIDHSLNHIKRTIENAKILAKIVGLKDNETNRLLSACVLHDIGYTHSRATHAMFGAIQCRRILSKHHYDLEDIEIISSDIANHNSLISDCYEFKESVLLMLADKLDLGNSRLNVQQLNECNELSAIGNIEYISFKSCDRSIEIELNCLPYNSIKQMQECPLISKLDKYFFIASEKLGTNIKLNINIRKAPIKN